MDNEDQMRRFLIWGDSQNNGYIKFTQYLDQQTSMMTMGMMQPSPYGKRQWEDFSHDDTSRFEGLRFVSPPPTDSSLSRSLAADFRAKLEKADVNAPAYGAALELLPVPSADLTTP